MTKEEIAADRALMSFKDVKIKNTDRALYLARQMKALRAKHRWTYWFNPYYRCFRHELTYLK